MTEEDEKLVENYRGGLEPPRFSLRRLLFVISLLAACFAAFVNFPPILTGAVLFALALVGLHVVGNAVGVRLRSSSQQNGLPSERLQNRDSSPAGTTSSSVNASDFSAPPTKLSHTSSLGWPLLSATGGGVLIGGVAGYYAMNHFYGEHIGTDVLAIGILAASALCGFWCFWCWSLLQVLTTAWWHAHSSATIDQRRTRQPSGQRRDLPSGQE